MQTFGEKYKKDKFYPEIEKIKLEAVIDIPMVIKDATIVKNFKTKMGLSTFALILATFADTETEKRKVQFFTVICSGAVVVEKIDAAITDKALPLIGTIKKVDTEAGNYYYDIE